MVILYQIVHYARLFVVVPWHVATFLVRLVWRIIAGLGLLFVSVGRPALRFLSFVTVIVAIVALVADATPALNGVAPFRPTLFSEHWASLAPRSLEAAEAAVGRALHPAVWTYGIGVVVNLPTFLLFGLISAIAAFFGRRRFAVYVFAN